MVPDRNNCVATASSCVHLVFSSILDWNLGTSAAAPGDVMAGVDWQGTLEAAQNARRANIVCMKWGDRYGPMWVNRLYGMVARNTSWRIRFVCFTDNADGIRPEVECKPLPPVRYDPARIGDYWPKLGLMSADLGGIEGLTLYLDLDLVVLDSIDPFLSCPGRFLMIREWKQPELAYGNSSVVRFVAGSESHVLDTFYATSTETILSRYKGKEQNFLTRSIPSVAFWPDDWCVSFAAACLPRNRFLRFFAQPRPPTGAKILVFFGSITPESALRGERGYKTVAGGHSTLPAWTRRRFGAAPWIADFWRE